MDTPTITAVTLSDDLRRSAHDLLERVERTDGVAAFSEAFLLALDRGGHKHFALIDGSRPLALASLAPDGSAELAVDPQWRRQGIGTALAQAVLKAGSGVGLWAHGNLPAAQALAASLSLRATRELLVMEVSGEALRAIGQEGTTAEALQSVAEKRDLYIEDLSYTESVEKWGKDAVEKAWLAANNEAFSWHPEQGGWDLDRLHRGMDVDWFDPDGVRLLWDGSTLAGFHWTKPHPDGVGEVYVVGLAAGYRGAGLGDPLMRAGIEYLVASGAARESVILYVEADNEPAVYRYENMGFTVRERHVVYEEYH